LNSWALTDINSATILLTNRCLFTSESLRNIRIGEAIELLKEMKC